MNFTPQRPHHPRHYRSIFVIVTEGRVTETSYIDAMQRCLKLPSAALRVNNPGPRNSSVRELIRAAKKNLGDLRKGDQVWILVDRDIDSHTGADWESLGKWEESSETHHVAISTPRFEYWLLLHFEETPDRRNALDDSYVARYLPGYDKKKDVSRSTKITANAITSAIEHSRARAFPTCKNPDIIGSGMHLLLQELKEAVTATSSNR